MDIYRIENIKLIETKKLLRCKSSKANHRDTSHMLCIMPTPFIINKSWIFIWNSKVQNKNKN